MKRVDIKTGFKCNNNCRFCVQADKKHYGNRDTKEILTDLNLAIKSGCKEVVFTGGECTIRKDILTLVKTAKKIGFSIIQIQTNGRMFANKEFCAAIINAGANSFSPSLHGHTAQLHDGLTRCPSSFEQTVKGIKNIKLFGGEVVTNTVIVKPNMKYSEEIANLLVGLKVEQFQLAFMHAMGNARKNFEELMPNATEAAGYIKKGLEIGIKNNIRVMAEAMPFCLMKGYVKYCSEFFIPETEIRDKDEYDPNFTLTRKKEGKKKFVQCKKCVYDPICEGPWKEYPERFGDEEFKPVYKDERD